MPGDLSLAQPILCCSRNASHSSRNQERSESTITISINGRNAKTNGSRSAAKVLGGLRIELWPAAPETIAASTATIRAGYLSRHLAPVSTRGKHRRAVRDRFARKWTRSLKIHCPGRSGLILYISAPDTEEREEEEEDRQRERKGMPRTRRSPTDSPKRGRSARARPQPIAAINQSSARRLLSPESRDGRGRLSGAAEVGCLA